MKRHLALALLAAIVSLFSAWPVGGRLVAHRPTPVQQALAAYARMTPAQRVGQLFMAGVASTRVSPRVSAELGASDIGNAILITDTNESRAAVKAVTKKLGTRVRQAGVAGFISTDQEGGEVQRLTGSGFSPMPTALRQGTLPTATLRQDSKLWGRELLAAGVNLDLAPVADTVPAHHARRNVAIGRYQREFGHTPMRVTSHVVAFVKGMQAAGVATAVKHFPGLGRASGNTDSAAHVTDPTTRHSPYLAPYQAGVTAGTQFVMVSSATYPSIDDQHPACFSATVITSMLRGDLGFRGVVISDDLGTPALARFSNASRATKFFGAGGTMLLDTSPGGIPAMIKAVLARAATSSAFGAQIEADTMTVLLAKANAGLISA
jgi:beta-N-acetylhexosaminidase